MVVLDALVVGEMIKAGASAWLLTTSFHQVKSAMPVWQYTVVRARSHLCVDVGVKKE